MADDKYTLVIDADGKPFINELNKIEKGTEKTASGISGAFQDAFKIKSLGDLVLGLGGAAKAAGFVADQIKKVGQAIFESVLEGEKIGKIEKQFSVLAAQSGQFGDDLAVSLGRAGKGLVDTTDILEASNQAFIQLGTNASKLPETLDLATKIVKVFGGEVVDAYEQINTAIASGNAKSLKQFGLIVDTEKVFKDFAKTIGTTVDLLTLEQKQFALTNAVLEKGAKSFENVSESANTATDSVKRLSVAYNDLTDAASIASAKTFGPALSSIAETLAKRFQGLASSVKEVSVGLTDTEKIEEAKRSIENLLKLRERASSAFDVFGFQNAELKELDEKINKQKELISLIEASRNTSFDKGFKSSGGGAISEIKDAAIPGLTPEQSRANSEKLLTVQKEFQAQQIALRQQGISLELADAQLLTDEKLKNDELDRIAEEQKILQTAIFEQQKLDIKTKFAGDNLIAQEQKNILLQEAEQNHQDTIAQIEAGSAARREVQSKKLNDSLNSILKSGLVNTFKNMGAALAKGENALSAFGKGMLDLIGNMLVEIGTSFLTIGLGVDAIKASIVGLTGGPAIAAGLALIVLGGLLSSLSGGGASAPSGGGGSTASGSTSIDPIASNNLNEDIQEKQTNVKIEVGGTVLDPVGVGLQIADILNETFNSTGTKVVVA
jgi:hypothetical protein